MRRADRLFLLIHALRGRRAAVPARSLADTLGVSLRTVYRDVADLQVSGVPIEGEAGVGYVLRKGADIPPLMFNADELEALVVGTRFVRAFGGTRMESSGLIDRLHAAIDTRHVLRLDYRDQDGRTSARDIEPLCLAFWGGSWTIGAWCRLRADFRSFRPDRIDAIDETGEVFADDPARGLDAYFRSVSGA